MLSMFFFYVNAVLLSLSYITGGAKQIRFIFVIAPIINNNNSVLTIILILYLGSSLMPLLCEHYHDHICEYCQYFFILVIIKFFIIFITFVSLVILINLFSSSCSCHCHVGCLLSP